MQMRRSTKQFVVSGVLVVIMVSLVFSLNETNVFEKREPNMFRRLEPAYIDHAPITIDGDINFNETAVLEGWSGNGSSQSPYIIENLNINGNGHDDCLSIRNTHAHFIITSCIFSLANQSVGGGVHLYNVTNGQIENNLCVENGYGIYVELSTMIFIRDNNCTGSYLRGIELVQSNFCDMSRNTMFENGASIRLVISHNNTIFNNTCVGGSHGIWLDSSMDCYILENRLSSRTYGAYFYHSGNNSLVGNLFTECGILQSGDLMDCIQTTVSNNKVNNLPLVYLQSEVGGTVSQIGGQVVLSNCSDLFVENQYLWKCSVGILLCHTQNVTLYNNTCIDNYLNIYLIASDGNHIIENTCDDQDYPPTHEGISIQQSDYNEVINNTVYGRDHYNGIDLGSSFHNSILNNTCMNFAEGIMILLSSNNCVCDNNCTSNRLYGCYIYWESSNNVVMNNSFSKNGEYGINLYSDCSNNSISWNILEDNMLGGALDDGDNNTFHYNYWSDYTGLDMDLNGIGDSPHPISGTSSNSDPYPLIFPPGRLPLSWSNKLLDVTCEFGSEFVYKVNVSHYAELDEIWLSDNIHFEIDYSGLITNTTILQVNDYLLEIFVNDTYGHLLVGAIAISVQDTIPPTLMYIPIVFHIEPKEEFSYQLKATDLSGIYKWNISDTIHFSIDITGLLVNSTILTPGAYPLSIEVFDPHGNFAVTTTTVIVDQYPSTYVTFTSTTTPPSSTSPTGVPSTQIDVFWIQLLIGGGAIIMVVIVIYKMKHRK